MYVYYWFFKKLRLSIREAGKYNYNLNIKQERTGRVKYAPKENMKRSTLEQELHHTLPESGWALWRPNSVAWKTKPRMS